MRGELAGSQDGDVRRFATAEVAVMRAATAPGTDLAYGGERVPAAWGFARSACYAMRSPDGARVEPGAIQG